MALNFPDSPTNGQKYTDPVAGETWTYESATNSWTSDGLTTAVGIQYKGGIDITAAPPAGVANGWQYTVTTGGTANAGFTGLTGSIPAGTTILYDGANWQQAGAGVKWDRTGTALKPVNAGDTVQISAGTAALPGLTPVGDPNTGIWAPAADTVAVSTNSTERFRVTPDGKVGVGTNNPEEQLTVVGGKILISSAAKGLTENYLELASTDASNALRFAINTASSTCWSLQSVEDHVDFRDISLNPSGGHVGIGTTNPGQSLTIGDGTEVRNVFLSGANSDLYLGGSPTSLFGFGSDAASFVAVSNKNVPLVIGTISNQPVAFGTANFERARLDSSGRLLVGASTSINALAGLPAAFQVQGAGANAFGSLGRWEAAASGPGLLFNKSRGASVGTRSIVSAGDNLGSLYFSGDDGTEFRESAIIYANAAGTPGANSVPADLVFATTAPTESAAVRRMRIKASGIVNIANVPTYADNTAAQAAGLEGGDIYRKADGTLMIAL